MKVLKFFLALVLACHILLGAATIASAQDQPSGVVIAQVQAGSSMAASQEYVSVYNNSTTDVDVTGWCLRYNGSNAKPGCITTTDVQTRLVLSAHTYTTFSSNEFISAHAGFVPQAKSGFVGGMSDSSGSLTLVDAAGVLQDQFSWGSKAASGKVFQRINIDVDVLKDTNIDSADFTQSVLLIPDALGLYEQPVIVDQCPNIEGVQSTLPTGYLQDTAGDCWQDICLNLPGLQVVLPDGYEQDMTSGPNACRLIPLENSPLTITEILPNVSGNDTGKEFVELYNPNDHQVTLRGYKLLLGPDFTKSYIFQGGVIEPGTYVVLSDTILGLVLPNTTASMRVVAPDGTAMYTTDTYNEPAEDESWALIDGVWQFTNQSTPGESNQASNTEPAVPDEPVASLIDPCPEGKYRNPQTNRCRNIETANSAVPCAQDEYRNPETNRCRKLAVLTSSSLTPCKQGQERNAQTNRCRATASATNSLQPCDEGEERNPETNRCKKSETVTGGSGPTNKQPQQGGSRPNIPLMAPVLVLAAGYAAFEYRYDAVNLWLRARQKLDRRRQIGTK